MCKAPIYLSWQKNKMMPAPILFFKHTLTPYSLCYFKGEEGYGGPQGTPGYSEPGYNGTDGPKGFLGEKGEKVYNS